MKTTNVLRKLLSLWRIDKEITLLFKSNYNFNYIYVNLIKIFPFCRLNEQSFFKTLFVTKSINMWIVRIHRTNFHHGGYPLCFMFVTTSSLNFSPKSKSLYQNSSKLLQCFVKTELFSIIISVWDHKFIWPYTYI